MKELLPSLIELFGTVSAIVIAFLILLYESSKRWIDRAKQSLLFEIKNFLDCKINNSTKTLPHDSGLYEHLLEEGKHHQVNESNVLEIIKILTEKIQELRIKNIENIPAEEAGKRAKDAAHLERYHKNDIEKTYNSYKASNQFYDNFPRVTKLAIGIPFLITALFILIYQFKELIIKTIGVSIFDFIVVLISFIGIFLIYKFSVSTLFKLKSIDK